MSGLTLPKRLLRIGSGPALGLALTLAPGVHGPAHAQSARFQQFPQTSPTAGEMAPDFTLMTLENVSFNLLEVAADQPVVVEFGSFT